MKEARGLSRRALVATVIAAAALPTGREARAQESNLSGSLWFAEAPCGAQPRVGAPCRSRRERASGVRIVVGRDGEAGREIELDGEGGFAINVPPGDYRISLAPGQPGLRMEPRVVQVPAEGQATVVIDIMPLRP